MKHAREQTGTTSTRDGLGHYRRLVELQSQLVELDRRNRETAQHCRELLQQLEREGWGNRNRRKPLQRWFEWLRTNVWIVPLASRFQPLPNRAIRRISDPARADSRTAVAADRETPQMAEVCALEP